MLYDVNCFPEPIPSGLVGHVEVGVVPFDLAQTLLGQLSIDRGFDLLVGQIVGLACVLEFYPLVGFEFVEKSVSLSKL